MTKICSVEQCERNTQAKGLCNMHYQRMLLGKPINKVREAKSCSVDGCTKGSGHLRRGMCQTHYARLKRTGSVELPLKPTVCIEDSCDKTGKLTRGLCQKHYEQWRRGDTVGATYRGDNHKNWRGGRSPRSSGYVSVKIADDHPRINMATKSGHIMEHRLVMADYLGRDLLPTENVHHVNGQKDDNRLQNLELWSTSQPAGQRVKDKLAWAKEFIARYGDDYSD